MNTHTVNTQTVNSKDHTRRFSFSRRRALHLSIAAVVTGAAIPMSACVQTHKQSDMQIWEAYALGAPCFIKLANTNAQRAAKSFALAEAEIARLENIFSLYKPDSEISRLNKDGKLENMSKDMHEILTKSHQMSTLTNGAFDISVQPLWTLASQMKHIKISQEGLKRLWMKARNLVDYESVIMGAHTVSFAKPNMAITLNAIAQGFITDKIVQLLIKRGHKDGLVNIGEFRAFGRNNAQAWKVGIQDPLNVLGTLDVISLQNQSLATSSALGGYIGEQIYHIFDTRQKSIPNGKPEFISASVIHDSAHIADALATAFTLMDEKMIRECAAKFSTIQILLVRENGELLKI